jgi:hypothetical protein
MGSMTVCTIVSRSTLLNGTAFPSLSRIRLHLGEANSQKAVSSPLLTQCVFFSQSFLDILATAPFLTTAFLGQVSPLSITQLSPSFQGGEADGLGKVQVGREYDSAMPLVLTHM